MPHYDELLKVLVEADFLDECDTKIAPRVDTAVDELFDSFPEVRFLEVRFLGGRSRKLSRSGPGTIRIRMTAGLADRLVGWGGVHGAKVRGSRLGC